MMALAGAYLASVGNVVGARNARTGVPVTQANLYGMAYGGLLTLAIHFGSGGELVMDWSIGYLAPMLYLTVFGSVVAFGCYMLLIGRIGAEYAAYVTLLMPIIALLLSTIFEDFLWTASTVAGVALVLIGNLFILTPAATLVRAYRRVRPS
jgi:drug/metabolite transporter (DMT)-like permease